MSGEKVTVLEILGEDAGERAEALYLASVEDCTADAPLVSVHIRTPKRGYDCTRKFIAAVSTAAMAAYLESLVSSEAVLQRDPGGAHAAIDDMVDGVLQAIAGIHDTMHARLSDAFKRSDIREPGKWCSEHREYHSEDGTGDIREAPLEVRRAVYEQELASATAQVDADLREQLGIDAAVSPDEYN